MSDIYSVYRFQTSIRHRERFGQFFTPEPVARFMIGWVLEGGANRLYDPAFGLGAFYLAAKALSSNVSVAGSEIDGTILNFWRENNPASDVSLWRQNYLLDWGKVHPAIVCNPPYMRFQRFPEREQVLKEFKVRLGLNLSGYTNIASAFLVKSISELTEGGRLAYIMPLEFLNTGYGELVKKYMLSNGKIHAIIRLDCEKDIFPDVITSVGILLFEKAASPGWTRFYVVHELGDLEGLLERTAQNTVSQGLLKPGDRWLKYFEANQDDIKVHDLVPLYTYGTFTRGIATGANEFFVLRPSQVVSLTLSISEVVPCITKSSHIRRPIFTSSDFEHMVNRDLPVWLFNAGKSPSRQAAFYIQYGEQKGFHDRYLTRNRNPWYILESRQPAPIWVGVFSRYGYKVVRNYSKALTLTCFHVFQANLFGASFVDHLFLYLMSATGRQIAGRNIRKYGDSLDKFEPNDLNQALAPSSEWFSANLSKQLVREEMEQVREIGKISPHVEHIFAALLVDRGKPLD